MKNPNYKAQNRISYVLLLTSYFVLILRRFILIKNNNLPFTKASSNRVDEHHPLKLYEFFYLHFNSLNCTRIVKIAGAMHNVMNQ